MAMNKVKHQIDSLPDGDPKKALLVELMRGKSVESGAKKELVRKLALERFNALSDDDPLKQVLGKMLGQEVEPPDEDDVDVRETMTDAAWEVFEGFDEKLKAFSEDVRTVDARSTAAMQEAQRLAAKSV